MKRKKLCEEVLYFLFFERTAQDSVSFIDIEEKNTRL
jgi:hypothetical protein